MVALATAAIGLDAVTVSASGPYTSGTVGYDVSYPQCGGSMPTGAFGIVGVNAGRPFSFNRCFASELSSAPNPTAYINTAYSGAYRKNITPDCSARAPSMAWAIGCSEAETSLHYAGSTPSMWWLDVEVGNSWSTSNLALNRAIIQGATDFLVGTGFPVGVYSTASSWRTITGGAFTPTNSAAEWVAGGSCASPFDAAPVWLSQFTSGGFDYDNAC